MADGDILETLDEESFIFLWVVPNGFLWYFVVEHVGKGGEDLSFDFIDEDTEDSASDHHSGPAEILEGVLFIELRGGEADGVIVFFEVHNFFFDLVEECGSNQLDEFFGGVVDGEARMIDG